ncbi:unnamed protein product, partial [Ectocarpus sp. 12 AP-2014]
LEAAHGKLKRVAEARDHRRHERVHVRGKYFPALLRGVRVRDDAGALGGVQALLVKSGLELRGDVRPRAGGLTEGGACEVDCFHGSAVVHVDNEGDVLVLSCARPNVGRGAEV